MMLRNITLIIISFLLFACGGEKRDYVTYELIAHAGGAIDGYIYTNSYEALCKAADDGYTYIELDLQLTSDSVLISAYDWEEFNTITDSSHLSATAPGLSDFLSRRIHGRYTPLTASDIDAFFKEHKDLFLVTDKISDAKLLLEHFAGIKERTVVEAFSYNDYIELKKAGFHRVLYSCVAEDMEEAIVKHLLLHRLFKGEKIEWVALHTSAFDNSFFKFVDALCDYKCALFTVNDTAEIPTDYSDKIYMIYTDSIQPCLVAP